VMGSSISESSGIPKRKKLRFGVSTGLAPQFTGQVFLRIRCETGRAGDSPICRLRAGGGR
jgi:hypothetical protein